MNLLVILFKWSTSNHTLAFSSHSSSPQKWMLLNSFEFLFPDFPVPNFPNPSADLQRSSCSTTLCAHVLVIIYNQSYRRPRERDCFEFQIAQRPNILRNLFLWTSKSEPQSLKSAVWTSQTLVRELRGLVDFWRKTSEQTDQNFSLRSLPSCWITCDSHMPNLILSGPKFFRLDTVLLIRLYFDSTCSTLLCSPQNVLQFNL